MVIRGAFMVILRHSPQAQAERVQILNPATFTYSAARPLVACILARTSTSVRTGYRLANACFNNLLSAKIAYYDNLFVGKFGYYDKFLYICSHKDIRSSLWRRYLRNIVY